MKICMDLEVNIQQQWCKFKLDLISVLIESGKISCFFLGIVCYLRNNSDPIMTTCSLIAEYERTMAYKIKLVSFSQYIKKNI